MFTSLANALIKCPPFKGRLRLLRLALRAADGGVVRSRYGVLFRVHSHDFTNWACISGAYGRDYDDVFEIVSSIKKGDAFVDVGANAGLFSMIAGGLVGESGIVVSFEPNKKVFDRLVDNSQLNGLSNIYALNVAVGDTPGTMKFRAGDDDHTGIGRIDEAGSEEVEVVTFGNPEWFKLIGSREITIKIDVEGAEALAIEGLRPLLATGQVKTVVVEIDEANLRSFGSVPSDIYAAMEVYGLRPHRGLNSSPHFNEVFQRVD